MKTTNSNFEKEIFKKASKTYFTSSLFFPKEKRQAVYELYSFVRLSDDFVDELPQDKKSFLMLKSAFQKKSAEVPNNKIKKVLSNIYKLQNRYSISDSDINSFLKSMEMDLKKQNYLTMNDTLDYIYGSAEVIGKMMAKILELQPKALIYAKYQGRSMQYINFIRDIDEDINLGRCYFPLDIRNKYNLNVWDKNIVNNPNYAKFISDQIKLYQQWQQKAEKGWRYIPYRSRIAVMTASDGYNYTTKIILKNPQIIFVKKVKPQKYLLLLFGFKNFFKAFFI